MDDAQTKQDPSDKTASADDKATPTLYTEDQLKDAIKKATSDAKANWGREKDKEWQAKVATLESQLKATRQEYETFRDEIEAKQADGNPDVEQILREKKALRELKAQIDAEKKAIADAKAEIKAESEKVTEMKTQDALSAAASKHGITVDDLKSELSELGITDPDRFDKIASLMKKPDTNKPDSALGVGMVNWRNMTPDQKIRYGMAKTKPK